MTPQNVANETLNQEETSTVNKCYSNLWTMFYRHGMNANLTKGFYFKGNVHEAKKRALDHCQIMGYKFIFVRPLVIDLKSEEEYKLRGTAPEELFP